MVIADINDTISSYSGTVVVVSTDRGIATVRDQSGRLDVLATGFEPGNVIHLDLSRIDRKWTVDRFESTEAPLRDLYPSSKFNKNELRERVESLVETHITDTGYNALCRAAIESEFFDAFLDSPAAASHHHAYIGGLAEHTCSMFELAIVSANHYEQQFPDMIDSSLLFTGVMFHDFMKVRELAIEGRITYTDIGNLIGHIPLVAAWLMELPADIKHEKRQLVTHLALSHHGKKEFGSPVEPKTVEAILLHHIDMIDSRMNMCWNSTQSVESGWTPYHRALGTRLLVHNKDET